MKSSSITSTERQPFGPVAARPVSVRRSIAIPLDPGKRPLAGSTRPRRDRNRRKGPLRSFWLAFKALYYASSPSWQILKSGALLLLGFFCWSAGNLLLSYEPTWSWTHYLMAYGFLVIFWGPVTHLVVVPHITPFVRRYFRRRPFHLLGQYLSLINFSIFFIHVVLFGLFPPGHLVFEFGSASGVETARDLNPGLTCTRDLGTIQCTIDSAEGIGSVVVETGGRALVHPVGPKYAFELQEGDLLEVVGQKQFEVLIFAPGGDLARSFIKNVAAI